MMARLREIDWRGWLARTPRAVGPVAFGLVVYVVALVLLFPYQRAGEFAEAMAANMGYDVQIGDVGPTFGIGVNLKDLRVSTMPRDGSKPVTVLVDAARVTTNPIANLSGGMAYTVSAQAFGGEVDVDIDATRALGKGEIALRQVRVAELPGVKEKIGLPVKGVLDLDIEMALEKLKMTGADGEITFTCEGCEVGDGKAKLKIESNPLLREGLAMPRLRLGNLVGKIEVGKGVGQITEMRAKSADMELVVEGEIRFADPVDASYLDVYVRFKLADKLVKSQDKLQLMLQFAGPGKRPDGFHGFRLSGPLRRLRDPQWMPDSPFPPGGRKAGVARPPKPAKAQGPV